jgi:hypothetical protein
MSAWTKYRIHLIAGFAILPPLLGGCTIVEPWERDVLARPEMSLDASALDAGIDDHIYFSKEASSGGRGFGGGGCGCN